MKFCAVKYFNCQEAVSRDVALSTQTGTTIFSKAEVQRKSEGLRAFAQESSPNKIDTRLSQLIFIRCWRYVV